MSEELSILSLVLQAGPVVQLVMATWCLRLFSLGLSSFNERVCYHGQKNTPDFLRIHF